MADAFGVAVGVPESQAELPRLRPNDESCSWLAAALKAHFELEDVEAEKALALVTCRPNFLKTNGMLRARRDRHPLQWSKLSQKIADVFADAEEAELTAATVEERLNFLHEDALPHWRSVCRGMPLPGTGGRAPCGGQSEAAASRQHCTNRTRPSSGP